MFSLQSPKQNRILAALPAEDYARLLPYLEFISMPLGQTIYEPRAVVTHLYFPTTSIVAPLYAMKMAHRYGLRSSAMRALPVFPLFWGAAARHLESWYKAREAVIG